jgi:hypothetical protein
VLTIPLQLLSLALVGDGLLVLKWALDRQFPMPHATEKGGTR